MAGPGSTRSRTNGPVVRSRSSTRCSRSAAWSTSTQIASTARTHWWSGTNEIQLARAAREFECDLVLERRSDAEQARKLLVKHLREQTPVLLCVDEWTHWITVLRAEDRRFVVVDSNDDPLLSRADVAAAPQLVALPRHRLHQATSRRSSTT